MHKIPHVALGKIQNRHVCRLFFPAMYSPDTSPALSPDILLTLYNRYLRPTVIEVLGGHAVHWPPDYDSAQRQARDLQGRLTFSTVDVPAARLDDFSSLLLDKLNQRSQFKDAFFGHELRGTKGQTAHDPFDEQERSDAMDEFFDFLKMEAIEDGEWWVDIGLEIAKQGSVLQWLESGHRELLTSCLPLLTEAQINRIKRPSQRFQVDAAATLYDLAGFRFETKSSGRLDQVKYINVYTTDKTVTYQLHSGLYRRRGCEDLLPKKIERLLADLSSMSRTFGACAKERQEGSARVELRVPLARSLHVLSSFPQSLMNQTLVEVPHADWW